MYRRYALRIEAETEGRCRASWIDDDRVGQVGSRLSGGTGDVDDESSTKSSKAQGLERGLGADWSWLGEYKLMFEV
jgi:hypothetical protein